MKRDIQELIVNALRGAFRNYPVEVRPSPEDERMLWVMVFNVPESEARAVKHFVYDLEETALRDVGVILLPMPKSPAVTREFYSEFAPADGLDTARALLKKAVREWYAPGVSVAAHCANDELALAA